MHTHTLCFWVWFPLLYSKAAALQLCMFRWKRQLPELGYCLGFLTEGLRTIILKVHGGLQNRSRLIWEYLKANLPRVTYYKHRSEVQVLILSLFWLDKTYLLKKKRPKQECFILMTRSPSNLIYLWYSPTLFKVCKVKNWLLSTFRYLKLTSSKLWAHSYF